MIIESGELSLHTITSGDIELLRQWRNEGGVNQYLLSRDPISPEDQQRWFQGLDPAVSIYFLIRVNKQAIGLVYAAGVDKTAGSFEGSIFIGDKAFLKAHYPVKAALMLSWFFFEHLNFQKAYSIVHKLNTSALDLDKRLGYHEFAKENDFIRTICSKLDYLKFTAPFRKMFFRDGLPTLIYQEGDGRFIFQ